ncbi:MAG: DNA translocase FtsK 4TM domain-containing protein [Thermodesulfovibrionales bacterium]|nr:DNA translocase FtsK 4TM domain-containing protein [Thermodesulfovibrionales bacterium]
MVKRVDSKGKIAAGILLIAGSIYLGLCLLTYSKWDPSFFTFSPDPVGNRGGIIGSYMADMLMSLLGVSSYSVPVFLSVYGIKGILLKDRHKINLAGALLFILSSSALAFLTASSFGLPVEPGMAGRAAGNALSSLLSMPGAYIFSIAFFLASVVLLSPASFIYFLLRIGESSPEPEAKAEARENEEAETSDYLTDEHVPEVFGMPPVLEHLEPLEVSAEEPGLDDFEEEDGPEAYVAAAVGAKKAGGYELPGIELLSLHASEAASPLKEAALSDAGMLERRLADFGVQGKVTQAHTGPVVTMYEFEPAPGVKINRVVSLSDDIALGLRAKSVRIAPIPGKSTIGLEVPNRYRETVSLREIISSDGFKKNPSKLTIALGKDIFGNPISADLTRMPHLLVAGSTGAGKSVALNAMVVSILYKASPDEVKMLLIDPKLLELSAYEGIPHLISPVITSPKEASGALRKIVFEMDRRYRLLAERGARNIDGFNASVLPEERIPYIVVVIDELADLMFTSASEVEDSIARLAQMARASGIHLVLATQRPSVDVITGVIKANFPARISFQVTSKIDSRTILDAQGAEQLIGKGDMLFMLPGSRTIRVHGALVTELEISAITGFVKAQGVPDYSIFTSIREEVEERENGSENRDDMYRKAVEYAESIGEVSISSIQRRLKVGYNRAARIMELMEEDGLVGPPKGAGKARDFIRRGI